MTVLILDKNYPKEQQAMRDSIRFMKHIASGTDDQSHWHIIVTEQHGEIPVVIVSVYRGGEGRSELERHYNDSLSDSCIKLEPRTADDRHNLDTFIKRRQMRLEDVTAMLRLFALNNHDENNQDD